MWQKIKQLTEERGQFLADMKAILKKSEDEKRDLTAEENTKFDELNTKAEQRKADIDRYERAKSLEAELAPKNGNERRVGRDDLNTPENQAEAKKAEQRAAFDRYLRHGLGGEETRALTVQGSGVVGDRPFYDQLVLGMKAYAGVRQAGATILPTSDGNPLTVPSLNDTGNSGVLVGETATSNSDADPDATGNITLGGFKFDSKWIKLSLELIQDAAYPVEATILSMAAERIGRALNTYTTTGTGSGQPKGFVTAGGVGKVLAATNAFTYEEIIDFIHSLDAAYRNTGKATVQFHDTTLAAIRKLKNAAGQYIWSAGAAGAPANILDFPYVVNNDLAKLTDGVSKVVAAFGDFSRYFVRDVAAPVIIRADELFIEDGLVGYKVFSRHDAALADTNAVKLLKTAAS